MCGGSCKEVEALIEAHPKALSTPDSSGSLPLNRAVRHQVGEGVIETLCRCYPDAACNLDPYLQQLPMMQRCIHGGSQRDVEALIEANPQAVSTRDSQGNLPVHYAVKYKENGEGVIETLYATIHAMQIDVANYKLFLTHASRLQIDQSLLDNNLLVLRTQWRSMQRWHVGCHMQCPASFRRFAFVILLVLRRNGIRSGSMMMMSSLLPYLADASMLGF